MWKLGSNDLLQLKGGGGERFVAFVDRLIGAEAFRGGLPQSEIQTQLRANIKDGGVDTAVNKAVPNDQNGWFNEPSCWQYKSTEAADINDKEYKSKQNDLQQEITKPYSKELIEKGFAYRFCLLGDLPAKKVEKWEKILKAEVAKINPNAPDPRVVHGGHLLSWAERFPAVIAWLRDLSLGVFHWEAWGDNCIAVTRNYVPNPAWEDIRRRIRQHVEFNSSAIGGDPCLYVGGSAGVGKTRLVFETLNETEGANCLVVYAADEQEAKKVATTIANSPNQTAILVADECGALTRHFLNENLRGHIDRLRVITIDNTGEKFASVASQIWLSAESLKNTDEILAANFPTVPSDRRHQYAQLSKGFVRLAADMCEHDLELSSGDLSGLLGSVEEYVRRRLSDPHLPLVSLIALFNKVGFRDDAHVELEALCQISGASTQQFRDAVRIVRESPGFVVQAGRYWYVSPEVVARVLFAEGWARWMKDDLANAIQRLPDHLQQELMNRAGRFGEQEVRDQLATFFRQSFNELTASDLADPRITGQALAIVEAQPEEYLPLLRSLMENASAEQLLHIRGDSIGAKWGPRRSLVWFFEELIAFPEFFADCEACLFHLALHETEPQIGNNATATWEQSYSVYLSGTATPFEDRINLLRQRTNSNDDNEIELAFRGVSRAMSMASGKVVGRPMVAGRLKPRDWQPKSIGEELACYRLAIDICGQHFANHGSNHHRLAFNVLMNNISFLLLKGLFPDLQRTLAREHLAQNEVRRLINEVDDHLEFVDETKRNGNSQSAAEYTQGIRDWIDSFRPTDLDGRLRSVCSREPWDKRFSSQPSNQRDETDELASEILAQPLHLQRHLDWLATPEAQSAERLAFAVGKADTDLKCAKMIFEHAIVSASASVVRGYVRGMVGAERAPSDTMLQLMERLESAQPEVAIELSVYGGDSFGGLKRAITLVESGSVSARYLAQFAFGMGGRELSADEAMCILPFFTDAAKGGDIESGRAGVRFVSTVLSREKKNDSHSCLDDATARDHVWELLEIVTPQIGGHTAYEWTRIVDRLAESDNQRAADLLASALVCDNLHLAKRAEETLLTLADMNPAAVMRSFGNALLDANNGWRLQVGTYREVLSKLRPDTVFEWIQHHGRDGACAVARHLPRPYLNESGQPIVPELLDRVLTDYDDDDVLNHFLAGSHSGEVWAGNASDRFRREADLAKRFLSHPNKRIREWAKFEIADREGWAEREDLDHAERFLPS